MTGRPPTAHLGGPQRPRAPRAFGDGVLRVGFDAGARRDFGGLQFTAVLMEHAMGALHQNVLRRREFRAAVDAFVNVPIPLKLLPAGPVTFNVAVPLLLNALPSLVSAPTTLNMPDELLLIVPLIRPCSYAPFPNDQFGQGCPAAPHRAMSLT